MKNEGYISNTQNLLSNETSRKMAKEVSWKYHQFLEMHHKNTNKKQKMLLIGGNKLQKHIKKCCFQTINTLFSRYDRNVSLKT